MTAGEPTLGAFLTQVAPDLTGTLHRRDGRQELAVEGRVVATWDDRELEVELGEAVGSAALRTADVHPSTRGPDWVRFRPSAMDRFARDRADSWIRFAARERG